jgi:hypothetical protein
MALERCDGGYDGTNIYNLREINRAKAPAPVRGKEYFYSENI